MEVEQKIPWLIDPQDPRIAALHPLKSDILLRRTWPELVAVAAVLAISLVLWSEAIIFLAMVSLVYLIARLSFLGSELGWEHEKAVRQFEREGVHQPQDLSLKAQELSIGWRALSDYREFANQLMLLLVVCDGPNSSRAYRAEDHWPLSLRPQYSELIERAAKEMEEIQRLSLEAGRLEFIARALPHSRFLLQGLLEGAAMSERYRLAVAQGNQDHQSYQRLLEARSRKLVERLASERATVEKYLAEVQPYDLSRDAKVAAEMLKLGDPDLEFEEVLNEDVPVRLHPIPRLTAGHRSSTSG